MLLRLPYVQSWAVNRVTGFLSSELKTRVEVGSVDFEFFRSFVFNDVYVQDMHDDTLLFVSNLKATIGMHTLFSDNKKLVLNKVQLTNARIELKRYKEDKGLSFQFLIDYFAAAPTDTLPPKPFDFSINTIVLQNNHVTYRDLRWDDTTPCIDFEDVDVRHLNAEIADIEFYTDSVACMFNQLSAAEKSGFKIDRFKCKGVFSANQMRFQDISIQTPFSKVNANYYSMEFDSIDDFYSYITNVRMKGSFRASTLSSNDIQYFAKELFGLNQTIRFEGAAHGTVDNIKAKNLFIAFGKSSLFKGDVSLNGLPDVESTFLNLKIEKLTVNKPDIETLKTFPFTSNEFIQLPQNLLTLGNATYHGVFTGFYNDFVAYGNISTALGYLSTDLNLKFDSVMDKSSYSGNLVANEFDFGKFWSLGSTVGKASFNAQIKGTGFTSDRVNAKLSASVSAIELNNYTYRSIEMDGDVAKKLFNGSLTVDDPNINLDFTGSVDFSHKLPVFNFSAAIKDAAISKLHITNRDTSARLTADATLNMTGLKFDDLDGNIDVENIQYSELNNQANVKSISFSSSKNGKSRWINLRSDIADAHLDGMFNIRDVPVAITMVLKKYLPSVFIGNQPLANKLQAWFIFNGKIKQPNDVLNLFVPGLRISDSTKFSGEFNSASGKINVNVAAPYIAYNTIKGESVSIVAGDKSNEIEFHVTSNQVFVSDSISLKNIFIDGSAQKNQSMFSFKVLNTDSSASRIDLRAAQKYFPYGGADFHFEPSTLLIENKPWTINPGNTILFDSSSISINNLTFSSGTESLTASGTVSRSNNNKLRLTAENFNTASLKTLLAVYNISIGGVANGHVEVANIYSKPLVTGEMNVSHFAFYGDTLGDASAKMDWVTDEKKIAIEGKILQNQFKVLDMEGSYFFKEHDEVDFKIKINKLNIQPFNHYLDGLASGLKGNLSANLHLYGLAKEPFVTGTAKVQRGAVLIEYLNTNYTFVTENEIELKERFIEFKNVDINDDGGNKAVLNGRIFHNHLSDFTFDLNIDAIKMLVLNTNATQNELFYGKGFASGFLRILGDLDIVKLKIGLKTEKGTQIFIPLGNPEDVGENDFIQFVSNDSTKEFSEAKDIDLTGIDLDFKLEATPDAEVQLLFDPKIGDVMRGRGTGDINMQITNAGEFKMYGDFNIMSGDYLFTLQNIINKKFLLQDGVISWSGSPYDAIIDVTTKYNLRTSMYDLIPDSSTRGRVPVEVLLNLSGNLLNPNVKFDINVPDTDPTIQSAVKSKLSSDQELNTQVFSLLVLNRFARSTEADKQTNEGSGNAVGQNVGELVSSQLSNWASQLSSTVDIGVNYRPGDALNNKDEFEVSLATELFSSRVSVEGNFGVANSTSQTSNIIGDFNVEFKINKDGNLRARAFNKTNSNNLINNLSSQYTQGIGVFYRREFNNFSELLKRKN